MYCNKTLKQYLDDLAAKLPAPGGGSAAALTASLGASLISMVVNFTLGKPKYAKYEDALKKILEKSEKLRAEFLNLVDLDVRAYQEVSEKLIFNADTRRCNANTRRFYRPDNNLRESAFDLRKSAVFDTFQKSHQSKNRPDALNVPFMVCRLCFEGIKLCLPLIKKGNVNLISDVAVGAVLLESAFTSAYFNVEINLKSLADKKLTKSIRKELKDKQNLIKRIRLETEAKIGKIIRG